MEDYQEYICEECGHETDTSMDSEFECPQCGIKMVEKTDAKEVNEVNING